MLCGLACAEKVYERQTPRNLVYRYLTVQWTMIPYITLVTWCEFSVPSCLCTISLQWRHSERDGVSNHQPVHCLLNRSFRRRSKKTSELRVTGLCAGISPVTGEFPAQKASNAENVSIWWRNHCLYDIWVPDPLSTEIVDPAVAVVHHTCHFVWYLCTFLFVHHFSRLGARVMPISVCRADITVTS